MFGLIPIGRYVPLSIEVCANWAIFFVEEILINGFLSLEKFVKTRRKR